MSSPFSPRERKAWLPPERLDVCTWAEKNRHLGPSVTATPGKYKVSRTPYLKGIMEELSNPATNEVAFMKPVQIGASEVGRNWIGRNCHVDPGPTMIVFPSEQSCRENMAERIIPMFSESPCLRPLLTGRPHDVQKSAVHLRSCSIYPGWSGSPQSLASRPIRYVLLDEVEKYAVWNGKEADPIALAEARTTTFRNRKKIFKLSTPTVANGPIDRAVKSCGDVRDYMVRCVHCKELLVPAFDKLQWEGREGGDEDQVRDTIRKLEIGDVVPRYECDCGETMTPEQFRVATKRGEWVSVGHAPGEHPESKSVGFRLSGLCAIPGTKGVAIEWMKTRIMGLGRLQHFYNSILGEPFWDEDNWDPNLEVTYEKIQRASETPKAGEVPEWASTVVVGADTNKNGHEYCVYAIGPEYRMQLLEYGECNGDDLLRMPDKVWRSPNGREHHARRICIDVGGTNSPTSTRTEDVYRLAQRDPAHIWPVKGQGYSATVPIKTSIHEYSPPGKNKTPFDVKLTMLDVNYLKDLLARAINEELWSGHRDICYDFIKQMASERKEMVHRKVLPDKTVKEVWRWNPKTAGIANHYWDATVYALAAAMTLEAGDMPSPSSVAPDRGIDRGDSGWDVGRRSGTWI